MTAPAPEMGLRVALSQLNPVVGDLRGNIGLMSADYERAVQAGAQVVVFPELSVTGYPPEDLLLKGSFIADNRRALEDFAAQENVSLNQTVAIGDGANDLEMIKAAGLGIAFNAKPKVVAAADTTISTKDLAAHFQRSRGGISSRLMKLGLIEPKLQ